MEKYQEIYNVLKQGNLSQLCNLANKLKVSHETPGITFYDNKKDLTYHLNYLIFHPGNSKSIFLRQADMILQTFKTY